MRYFLFTLLFLLISTLAEGRQEEAENKTTPSFDRSRWKEMVSSGDFNYEKKKPEPQKKPDPENEEQTTSNFDKKLIKNLLLATLISLLAFLIFRFLFFGDRKKGDDDYQKLEAQIIRAEEALEPADFDSLLADAEAQEAYHLAFRIRFLVLIRMLSDRREIRWQKEKTNAQYLQEVQGKPYAANFTQLKQIFDQIWYGQRKLSAEAYNQYISLFKQIGQTLPVN